MFHWKMVFHLIFVKFQIFAQMIKDANKQISVQVASGFHEKKSFGKVAVCSKMLVYFSAFISSKR